MGASLPIVQAAVVATIGWRLFMAGVGPSPPKGVQIYDATTNAMNIQYSIYTDAPSRSTLSPSSSIK